MNKLRLAARYRRCCLQRRRAFDCSQPVLSRAVKEVLHAHGVCAPVCVLSEHGGVQFITSICRLEVAQPLQPVLKQVVVTATTLLYTTLCEV